MLDRPSRWKKWTRPPRELALTRTGKFLCLLTLGVGFGAINTGNNLLFLLFGMMMTLILASGVLSEAVIRNLRAERVLPNRLVAGLPARGAYVVHNNKEHASLSIEATDRMAVVVAGPAKLPSTTRVGRTTARWWQFWKPTHDGDEIASVYVPRIEASTVQQYPANFRFEQRGHYLLDEILIDTRFPFSFFEKRRRFETMTPVIVHPASEPADDWLRQVSNTLGDMSSTQPGQGQEFYEIREYRDGEDVRKVHWKSSARRGKTLVRQTERELNDAVHLVLCYDGTVEPHTFERLISKTVGLLRALSDNQVPIGVTTREGTVLPDIGRNHLDSILDQLAVLNRLAPIQPAESPSNATVIGIGTAQSLAGSFDAEFVV